MNSPVSSAPSSPRGACTTSAGEGAECVAAAGQDRITAVPARSPLSPASSTDSHKDLATEPVSGRDIARWPDFFLELVLCWLRPCDLARCSRVCRQWYRVAGSVELQARSFSRTCPRLQQQWLQQAQDAEGVRQSLAGWCERLAWSAPQRTQLEELVIRGLSFRGFFYVLLQHRLCAERFADSRHDTVDAGRGRVRQLVCSPDSRYLAASPLSQPCRQHHVCPAVAAQAGRRSRSGRCFPLRVLARWPDVQCRQSQPASRRRERSAATLATSGLWVLAAGRSPAHSVGSRYCV